MDFPSSEDLAVHLKCERRRSQDEREGLKTLMWKSAPLSDRRLWEEISGRLKTVCKNKDLPELRFNPQITHGLKTEN